MLRVCFSVGPCDPRNYHLLLPFWKSCFLLCSTCTIFWATVTVTAVPRSMQETLTLASSLFPLQAHTGPPLHLSHTRLARWTALTELVFLSSSSSLLFGHPPFSLRRRSKIASRQEQRGGGEKISPFPAPESHPGQTLQRREKRSSGASSSKRKKKATRRGFPKCAVCFWRAGKTFYIRKFLRTTKKIFGPISVSLNLISTPAH